MICILHYHSLTVDHSAVIQDSGSNATQTFHIVVYKLCHYQDHASSILFGQSKFCCNLRVVMRTVGVTAWSSLSHKITQQLIKNLLPQVVLNATLLKSHD